MPTQLCYLTSSAEANMHETGIYDAEHERSWVRRAYKRDGARHGVIGLTVPEDVSQS